MNFLTVPAEIRCRIYTFLFLDLCVTTPAISSGSVNPATQTGPGSSEVVPETSTELANLAIFRVCRKCYDEACSVFWNTAHFQLHTIEQHRSFTQVDMLPSLRSIHHLSVDSALLAEWSPTLLRLVMRSLSIFTILNVEVQLFHADMVRIEHRTGVIDSSGGSDYSQIDNSPSLVLFRSLVAALDETKGNQILGHFDACHGQHTLKLEFRIRCRHIGQVVVPGTFPMAGTPHVHEESKVMYSFNA